MRLRRRGGREVREREGFGGGGNARTGGRDGEEEVTELVGVEHVAHLVRVRARG